MKKPRKSKAAKQRNTRAKTIRAAATRQDQLDLAIFGQRWTDEHQLISKMAFLRNCLQDAHLMKSVGKETFDSSWDLARKEIASLMFKRVLEGDPEFFREFAEKMEAVRRVRVEDRVHGKDKILGGVADPIRAAVLTTAVVRPPLSFSTIAKTLGVDVRHVRRVARELGLKPTPDK